MKLPNDLVKSTDYEKAKDREIHEFECVNGKFVHHYVLGGEHELTEQEVVDCLNALATLDCDLSTAYAFIEGQNERMKELEKENQQLEQSQNSKAIEVLEKVKNELFGVSNPYWRHFFKTGIAFASCDDIEFFVEEYIDNQIKELDGEI